LLLKAVYSAVDELPDGINSGKVTGSAPNGKTSHVR